ncbi:TetR/AcrR family transcriptional regulator [Cellulomonas soli]|uniref:TetR family transcriptional regulator n=1 Tax=Cellulomonas soli TaxID=931535 RepID=A0A512P8E6_9CELL|nr:TetR/AcrR family transcriptional regulator [Cellulomonas soli]NYI57703.1 AcrR family transcriptional regulator [Cellulomonas soli]GEP67483.1 TetR family transcriptional regulator [Cellulomonas soli]
MSTAPARAPRADAQRNREKLLAVAAAALAEDGDVPLETIAARAGVGIGTLYRHFPQRNALVEAAYRQEVQQLCDAAPELLAPGRPAVESLREWMGRFVRYAATKRGMGAALRAAVGTDSPLFGETRERIVGALAVLLQAGAVDGTIRQDVGAEDVLRAMGAVWSVGSGPEWDEQVRRLLDLVVDGLRFGASAR